MKGGPKGAFEGLENLDGKRTETKFEKLWDCPVYSVRSGYPALSLVNSSQSIEYIN